MEILEKCRYLETTDEPYANDHVKKYGVKIREQIEKVNSGELDKKYLIETEEQFLNHLGGPKALTPKGKMRDALYDIIETYKNWIRN